MSTVSGGSGKQSKFNKVHVDRLITNYAEFRKAQVEKFDMQDRMTRKRSYHSPLSIRGWTSKSFGGLSVGAPDAQEVVDFHGFQTKILEVKRVCHYNGRFGRQYRKWVLVVTGNYDGIVGFGFARAELMTQAVRKAKAVASKRLIHVERNNDSSIYTDSTVDVDRTTVHMRRGTAGNGLTCSRVIREIMILAGFKNIYAKIEGPTNTLKVVQAVFQIISSQKTYQQLADEKKLNVVLFRKDFPHYPVLLAAPSDGKTLEGRNLAPDGEFNDEELNQVIYDIDQKDERREKIRRYYGINKPPNHYRRPGLLNPDAFKGVKIEY